MIKLYFWGASALLVIGFWMGATYREYRHDKAADAAAAPKKAAIRQAGAILQWISRLDEKPPNVGKKVFEEYQNKATKILNKILMRRIMRGE